MRVVSVLADEMGCIVSGSEHAGRLVRFWRTLELFGPQLVPEAGACPESGGLVVELGADELAPWENTNTLPALKPGRVWQFVVYGGLFGVGRAREALIRTFGEDQLEADARRGGTTAAFAVTLTDDGVVVPESATLSGLAWAVNRLRSPGPADSGWADGYEHDSTAFTAAFDTLTQEAVPPEPDTEQVGPAPRWRALDVAGRGVAASVIAAGADGVISPGLAGMSALAFAERLTADDEFDAPRLTGRDLHTFTGELCGALGIRSELRAGGVRVACVQVATRDADTTATEDRLNSGLGADLAELAAAVERGDIGAALRDYLAATEELPVDERIDVRERQDVVVEGLLPHLLPDGRWPGDPLVSGQQFAVDRAMAQLRDDAGIFAVHGAPGTGTTTMLRDLLAGIVVERAGQLAAFDDPMTVFTGITEQVQVAKNYTVGAHRLTPAVTGFEVVLATGSDETAADVVAEIQHREAIDRHVQTNHFTELAELVSGQPAWGLVAAALGGTRRTFGEQFWFGDRFATDRKTQASSGGMLDILKHAEADPDSLPDWQTAVRDFASRRAEVRKLAQQRQDVADAVAGLPAMNDGLLSMSAEISNADAAHAHWRERHQLATEHLRAAQAAHHRIGKLLGEHGGQKPGFVASLSTGFRAGRRWSARSNELLRERHIAESDMRRRQTEVDYTREQWAQAAEHGRTLIRDHVELTNRRTDALDIIERARENWAHTIPFGDVAGDDEQFQLCNPWADEQYCTARRELFLSALRLHRAFLLNAAPRVRDNLIVAIALIRGELATAPKPETVAAAWQTLFLAVPMVTTTFTALPRLFEGLGREALGWLFVDDAGQAAPQSVAGGLWRARRAVIVGDHRQLGPAEVLPTSAQEALVRQFGLEPEWLPDRASARQAADRAVRFGTWLAPADYDEPVWVGTPLRVHRRSDLPIFELTHRIAYDEDLLVFGTPQRTDFPGHDRWIDVRSARAEGNWIPGEGAALAALLAQLAEDGIAPTDIRVVSPFRDVARGARAVANEVLGAEFAASQVGTVHAMRGRSAEVVVLILGTSPAAGGSRRWAAANPSVLNAAVSRARRRVYVIGNYRLWSSQRYFDVLAEHWPADSDQLVQETVSH
ncbi:DEAD/DEAH box helicase [Nocardia halotolerans]|uniref:DEAD/DEAH box helicase n=1 Tax=Nocardia halotolerans TaxID=1755878 RepID=A0ABV8V9S9_9NOCA